jgi:hypothetical protein
VVSEKCAAARNCKVFESDIEKNRKSSKIELFGCNKKVQFLKFNMKVMRYILRSVKYLVKLIVLLALLFLLMKWSGMSSLSFDSWQSFFAGYFAGYKGIIFTVAVLVWSAVYPRAEFITRSSNYDIVTRKSAIIKALSAGGMVLASESEGRLVFRGEGLWRRIWFMGDEAVTITRNNSGGLDIEGPRRFVVEAVQRIPAYVNNEANGAESEK